jgi:hypothetical protein
MREMSAGLPNQRCCDFCGLSETKLAEQVRDRAIVMVLDEDGLWVCQNCRAKLLFPAAGGEAGELAEALRVLVGKSAGAICYTLNLPYEPPYRSVIDAASQIAYDEDRYMSAWSFIRQWNDGSTVWRNEDGSAMAIVASDGSVSVHSRSS